MHVVLSSTYFAVGSGGGGGFTVPNYFEMKGAFKKNTCLVKVLFDAHRNSDSNNNFLVLSLPLPLTRNPPKQIVPEQHNHCGNREERLAEHLCLQLRSQNSDPLP